MIFAVLLVPPLLLCAVLALGRYEEYMFTPHEQDAAPRTGWRHALRGLGHRHGRHAA
ncbi:hypothetical protein ACM614_21405 [Streptomyces sp. 12297]|uniref:hypothetical protein n=1 Tax=Streptomyces sp. NBC_00239 TaxID=2903640 RepID=UPI002E2D1DBE|nr:hypothetical protein [Streptomyces sp. NBC_00239]